MWVGVCGCVGGGEEGGGVIQLFRTFCRHLSSCPCETLDFLLLPPPNKKTACMNRMLLFMATYAVFVLRLRHVCIY